MILQNKKSSYSKLKDIRNRKFHCKDKLYSILRKWGKSFGKYHIESSKKTNE